MFELRARDAYVDGLGFDAFVLGFGLGDVDFGGDSAFEADLCELEIVGVGRLTVVSRSCFWVSRPRSSK